MNGPLKMYQLRQIIRHDLPIELPKCMYTLKNIHTRKNGMVDESTDHVSSPKKKLDIFEQVKQFLKNNQGVPEMAELEAKQEDILKQLSELKTQILSIKSNLKASGISQTKTAIDTASQKITNDYSDIVINASPTNPPHSLQIIQKIVQDKVNLIFSFHLHSTVSSLPENVEQLVKHLRDFSPKSDIPKLNVKLIWKNVGPNTELLVSHTPILGEANLLRYLSRAVSTPFTYHSDPDSLQIDSILDVAHLIVRAKNKTERANLFQFLNKALGKSQWLLGRNHPSIADIAAYSAIKQVSNTNEMGVTLGRWFHRCESLC